MDFIGLVRDLDAELAKRDGNEHAFYHQFNKIDQVHHVILAYLDGKAVGCGGLKQFDGQTMEIKRMFVLPLHRGKGIASMILEGLEEWAAELSFRRFILETGKRQPEAIALYFRNGYRIIPNYGQYLGIANSVCFEKLGI